MQDSSRKEFVVLSALRAHLPDWARLSENEVGAVLKLQSTARSIRRGGEIIVQGRRCDSIFVLSEGFALRYRLMPDGRRHVLNVSIPGDTVGYPACFFDTALYSVSALSKAVVYAVSFGDIATIFRNHPRAALALFWSTAREAATLAEHLADVGWRNAYERLAHFLLEMATRLANVGMSDGSRFELPLTQAKLADVLGLSIPHVNRMLRRLREDGLIEMAGAQVRIVDRSALASLADFDESYLSRSPTERAAARFESCAVRKHNGHPASLLRAGSTPAAR